MNKIMLELHDRIGDKFDPAIMEGLSRYYMDGIADYLDMVLKSAVATLSADVPFVYKGFRYLTPKEDFENNVTSSMYKNIVDISTNYLFKIELGFEYNGMIFNRVLALPYVDRGGHMILSDANYVVTPVLSEYPISPAPGEVFVRLLRDKLNIKRMDRGILLDGQKVSKPIIHSKSYKLLKDVNNVIPIALYLFIKHGFYGVYEKYFNTKPIIVTDHRVDTSKYADEYAEYTTRGVKPRVLQVINYTPHTIRIYIKRSDITPFLETVTASLIYSFDMSPLFAMEIRKVVGKKKVEGTTFTFEDIDDESLYWITLLGKIIFKNKYSLDRVQSDMLEHIDILNSYMDTVIKNKLRDNNILLDDFYELLGWIMENYDDMVLNYKKYSSKLSNRYMCVLYYIGFDLIVGINKAFLEFKRTTSRKEMVEKELNTLFNKYISTRRIFDVIKGGSSGTNLAITPIDYTGDNLYYKMSSVLEDQNRGDGIRRSKRNVLPPNTRTIHAEDIVFGSILFLIKKYPSPRFRINPTVAVDMALGKILMTDEDERFVDLVEPMLSTKFEDKDISENEIVEEYKD